MALRFEKFSRVGPRHVGAGAIRRRMLFAITAMVAAMLVFGMAGCTCAPSPPASQTTAECPGGLAFACATGQTRFCPTGCATLAPRGAACVAYPATCPAPGAPPLALCDAGLACMGGTCQDPSIPCVFADCSDMVDLAACFPSLDCTTLPGRCVPPATPTGLLSPCLTTANCASGTYCLDLTRTTHARGCAPTGKLQVCMRYASEGASCLSLPLTPGGPPVVGDIQCEAGLSCVDGYCRRACSIPGSGDECACGSGDECVPGGGALACQTCWGPGRLDPYGAPLRCDSGLSACCGGFSCVATGPEAGTCACTGAICGASSCVDVQTDPLNCGGCGHACAAGQSCCDGTCSDTTSDPLNCGHCGTPCPVGTSCSAGTCHCGGIGTLCSDGLCHDLMNDSANCRSCGHACSGIESCCGGDCCSADCCEGSCTDLDHDHDSCGTCGHACAASETCCGGGCFDTNASHDNCGDCGVVCAAGQACCRAGCVDTTSLQIDHDNCGACGHACAVGEKCCGGTCSDNTADNRNCGGCGTICAAGYRCCDSACAVIDSSTGMNCSQCGKTCAADAICVPGHCYPCDPYDMHCSDVTEPDPAPGSCACYEVPGFCECGH